MSSKQDTNDTTETVLGGDQDLEISIQNLGGIDSFETTISPGITLLSGSNATNRTSFLQAFATALGGNEAIVRGRRDDGTIELSVDGETYTRIVSSDGSVSGEAPVPHADKYGPFTWLFTDNPIRQAVGSGGDLRETVLAPVDLQEIQREIRSKQQRKRELGSRIENLESDLHRVEEIEISLKEKRQALSEKEQELKNVEDTLEEVREELGDTRSEIRSELDEARDKLQEARQSRDQARSRLASLQDEVEEAEATRDELQNRLADLKEEQGDYEETVTELQTRQDELQDEINELELVRDDIIEIRQLIGQLMDREESRVLSKREMDDSDHITDQLEPTGSSVMCFACGQATSKADLVDQYDHWQDQLQQVKQELRNLEGEKSEIRKEISRREDLEDDIDRIQTEIARIESNLEGDREMIETVQERIEKKEDRIESLETEVAEIQKRITEDLVDREDQLKTRQTELNQEIGRLTTEIEQLEEELDSLSASTEELDEARAERESISEDLRNLRTRLETLETNVVTEFNDRIDDLLSVLAYENIETIRLERKGADVGSENELAGIDADIEYQIELVRTDEDDVAYTADLTSLSESEREVVAITFAIAGYLAHDIDQDLPIILFDGIEMIDADRLWRLFNYVNSVANYTVAAVLPEDADRIGDGDDVEIVDFGRNRPS